MAALVASLRVVSGDHFVSDVAAGAALGALIGFGVPYLHRVGSAGRGGAASALALRASPGGLVVDLSFAP